MYLNSSARLVQTVQVGGGDYVIMPLTPSTLTVTSVTIGEWDAKVSFADNIPDEFLFDLTVVVGGTFRTQVRIANFELWQLAALNLLLLDLRDEMLYVGSGRSRGLATCDIQVDSSCASMTMLS